MYRRLAQVLLVLLVILLFHGLHARGALYNPPPGSKITADSIIAAIDRGEDVFIDSCEILGPLTKEGTLQKADTIKSVLSIRGSTFEDKVCFSRCCFTKPVALGHSAFRAEVNFSGVIFREDGSFSWNIFAEGVSFVLCTFGKDAYFSGVTFEKWTTFRGTRFSGRANFVFTTFTKWASFKDAVFGGSVSLSPTEFRNISRLSWRQLEGHLNYSREANFKLMKHFEERRMLEDADGIYLFLKDQERIRKPGWIRYSEYWFIQLTCGYGVKPLNTLYISIGVIIFFAFLYTKKDAIRRRMSVKAKTSFYDSLYYSIQTFIIGVVPDWYPTDQFLIKMKRFGFLKFRTISMIEGALGWILVILFIISLGRKFIR